MAEQSYRINYEDIPEWYPLPHDCCLVLALIENGAPIKWSAKLLMPFDHDKVEYDEWVHHVTVHSDDDGMTFVFSGKGDDDD